MIGKNRIRNRLDMVFGPVGSASGIFLFIGGILILTFSLLGIVIILLGAFAGFSYTSVDIDFEMRRIRFSNNLFGLINTGRWISVLPDMRLGISGIRRGWKSYSRGGVPLDISEKDFRIILYGSGKKAISPVKKCKTLEEARVQSGELAEKLGLGLL